MLRRSLLRWLGALGLAPKASAGAASASPAPVLEAETLRAVASTVLPASLGAERIEAVAAAFRGWLRAYAPGADRGHGYGHTRLSQAPQSPEQGYARQLAALDAAARARGAPGFAGAGAEDRRLLIDAALKSAEVERLPDRPDGRHVAADLMAFFFRSSEANDLCYRARIGRDTCRGLPDSPHAPARIAEAAPQPKAFAAGGTRSHGGS